MNSENLSDPPIDNKDPKTSRKKRALRKQK